MREEIFQYVKKKYKTVPDYPFRTAPTYSVLRHADTDLIYAGFQEAMEYLAKTSRCARRDLNPDVSLFRPEGAETATKTLKLGDSVQWRT